MCVIPPHQHLPCGNCCASSHHSHPSGIICPGLCSSGEETRWQREDMEKTGCPVLLLVRLGGGVPFPHTLQHHMAASAFYHSIYVQFCNCSLFPTAGLFRPSSLNICNIAMLHARMASVSTRKKM